MIQSSNELAKLLYQKDDDYACKGKNAHVKKVVSFVFIHGFRKMLLNKCYTK